MLQLKLAIANVADQGTKDRLTHRVGLVQNAITVREQQAAEAERARQVAAAEQERQAKQQQRAFVTNPQQAKIVVKHAQVPQLYRVQIEMEMESPVNKKTYFFYLYNAILYMNFKRRNYYPRFLKEAMTYVKKIRLSEVKRQNQQQRKFYPLHRT